MKLISILLENMHGPIDKLAIVSNAINLNLMYL